MKVIFKKAIAAIVVWQVVILLITVLTMGLMVEVVIFSVVYLQVMTLVTTIIGLALFATLGIVYLMDDL